MPGREVDMKQLFFTLPAIKRSPGGFAVYRLDCKLTPWGIMLGSWRLQWRDADGWCWRTGI